MISRETEKIVGEIAKAVVNDFSESDWKILGQRVGFRELISSHPRLLRSLRFKDEDYLGHALDMLNKIVDDDQANIKIIQAMLVNDDTAFFECNGRYQTRELIGQGGYGQVYRELDTLLDLEFARKDLSPSPFVTDEVIGRFLREARILFRLSHPYIIGVRDIGRRGRNVYIRMELFEGIRLGELGQTPPQRARVIVAMISSAIAHAHARGIVHRDLKPSNVLVLDNDLRVIDFGMGAFIEADIDTRLTRSDQSIAGGSYAAPELKENSHERDLKCDVFSIGAIWFNLVTGRDPSGADLPERLSAIGDLPASDRSLILNCMSDLRKRPSSSELLRSIETSTQVENVQLASEVLNELSDNETRILAAFAMSYPLYGEVLEARSLFNQAKSAGLGDNLLFGLAVASLERKGYIQQTLEDEGRYWWLTATGKNWLSHNGDVVVQLLKDDEDDIPF